MAPAKGRFAKSGTQTAKFVTARENCAGRIFVILPKRIITTMAKSGDKGKRGEREFCRELREWGFGAIRSAQVTGVKEHSESADIITSLDDYLRFEVKRGYEDTSVTSAQFEKWSRKALDETPDDKETVLAWRKNRQPWRIFIVTEIPFHWKMFISVDRFVNYLSTKIWLDDYSVPDPSSWKTTGTFGG